MLKRKMFSFRKKFRLLKRSDEIAYKSQSTAIINEISSDGRPTVSKTMTIVTKPADGIPAAPIDAAVAVTL